MTPWKKQLILTLMAAALCGAALLTLRSAWIRINAGGRPAAARPPAGAAAVPQPADIPPAGELAIGGDKTAAQFPARGAITVSGGSKVLGPLAVYNAETGLIVLNTDVDGSPTYDLSAEYLGPGNFVAILTGDPDQCADLTLAACRASSYFKAERGFAIVAR